MLSSQLCKLKLVDIELAHLGEQLDAIETTCRHGSLGEWERGIDRAFAHMEEAEHLIKDCNCEQFDEGLRKLRATWEIRRSQALRDRATSDAREAKLELQSLLEEDERYETACQQALPPLPDASNDLQHQAWSEDDATHYTQETRELSVGLSAQGAELMHCSTAPSDSLVPQDSEADHLRDRIASLTSLLEKADAEIRKLRKAEVPKDAAKCNATHVVVGELHRLIKQRRQAKLVDEAFERGREYERHRLQDEYSSWRRKCEEAERSYMEMYRGRIPARPMSA